MKDVNSIQKQSGVVLLVALIMLLVMTAVGITTMSGATMQERMSGNNRQLMNARINAETALRRAEEYLTELNITNDATLETNFIENTTSTAGHYYPVLPMGLSNSAVNEKLEVDFDYKHTNTWTSGNSREVLGLSSTLTAQNPRFFIEFIGNKGGLLSRGTGFKELDVGSAPPSLPYVFRITAIGYGANQEIYSILQSTYETAHQ